MHYCLEMNYVRVMAEPADRVCVLCACGLYFFFLLLEIGEAGTLELFMLLLSEIFMTS